MSDEEIDAELRAHGGDPAKIRREGAALAEKLRADRERLKWLEAAPRLDPARLASDLVGSLDLRHPRDIRIDLIAARRGRPLPRGGERRRARRARRRPRDHRDREGRARNAARAILCRTRGRARSDAPRLRRDRAHSRRARESGRDFVVENALAVRLRRDVADACEARGALACVRGAAFQRRALEDGTLAGEVARGATPGARVHRAAWGATPSRPIVDECVPLHDDGRVLAWLWHEE